MVDNYEYEEGTLNEIWSNFHIKEDEVNDRLVIQRQDAARTEIAEFASDGTLSAPVSVSKINNIEYIDEASDLPAASGGERQLEDSTGYYFTDFVSDPASLRLGTDTVLIGAHGGLNGYIHTGASDAIVGTNKGVFIRNMYVHAPGGTIFNVSGTTSEEVLIEMSAFSDAANLGEIASLGTFDGFRVPSFKGCNFEDFQDGLTFTGTSEKVFFSESPFRTVTQSGVTCLHFDANCSTDIVDITDCYVKGVQSDTVVIDVDPSATISEIFQYRGTTHDPSVTESNILTGQASIEAVGYRVTDSYPLEDSGEIGELSLDSPTAMATAAAGAGTYTVMDDGATTISPSSERFSQPSNGTLQYDGKSDIHAYLTANVTLDTGGNNVAVAVSKNGSVESSSEMSVDGSNATDSFLSAGSIVTLSTGDTVEAQIKNNDAASDVTVQSYTLNIVGV